MQATNPFDSANLDDASHSGDCSHDSFGRSHDHEEAHASPLLNQSTITDISSQLSISPSLFPPTLSSWMDTPKREQQGYAPIPDSDDEQFHDCISEPGESPSSLFDTRNAMELNSPIPMADESTSWLAAHHDVETPLMDNTNDYKSTHRNYNSISATPLINNTRSLCDSPGETPNNNLSADSPLQDALSTWLEPYARSAARKAGRRLLSFEDEGGGHGKEDTIPEKIQSRDPRQEEDTSSNGHVNSAATPNNGTNNKANVVRFHLDSLEKHRKRQPSPFQRAASSPALMTSHTEESVLNHSHTRDTIVLKEIEHNNNNNPDDDGSVMHPWTKLILLEELGTAQSWTVLLLPYAFMILALFLDGDASLKNEVVGPLRGNRHCVDVVGGRVAEPFGVSVKGYFPVPFSFTPWNDSALSYEEACAYPFELREGVGLLSNGMDDGNNATSAFASIVDPKYHYLMSHGYAFTSGVIPNVPATTQSLIGTAQFNNLSSRAVALVADGSVLLSTIVFQRKPLGENDTSMVEECDDCHTDNNNREHTWSPVLILSPRKLDLRCTLNEIDETNETRTAESTTWNCVSKVVEAFFSLPNTALLIGGDLRVDTLLSHHKQHTSLSDDFWLSEMNSRMGYQDNGVRWHDDFYPSKSDLIWDADITSKPKELVAELSEKAVFLLKHQSESYNTIVETTRIVALLVTFSFLCYWCWSMGYNVEDFDTAESSMPNNSKVERIKSFIYQLCQSISRSWKKSDDDQSDFWWESPWITFPERRYLLLMLFCLILLQNPLLVYAFFRPSLYSSATFRSIADSLSGMSVHGLMFLWLCLMHGLRYHTADFSRRRYEQHKRVIELQKATTHMSLPPELENSRWGRVQWYYRQYGEWPNIAKLATQLLGAHDSAKATLLMSLGDVDGGGAVFTSALRHKHDINSDSFVEFLFPKMLLLALGLVSSVTAATSRFPGSEIWRPNEFSASFLNPDRFGGRGQLYVISSIVQIIVIQLWSIAIVITSFVTGERLKREPFLSTRPAQLAFRVLSSILLLGVAISITLFSLHTRNMFGDYEKTSVMSRDGNEFVFDTSVGSRGEAWDSKAVMFGIIRRMSAEMPYVDTSFNIGPGKILYATACSLVAAYIFIPSSHFRASDIKIGNDDLDPGLLSYSKNDILWVRDKMLQGTDKRFVVTLARKAHSWRIFPLPIRSHGLLSQHTLKESLNLIGTFQLDGGFEVYRFKNGRGSIFKGRYIPVFCVEIACWLLEASWQSYYSPFEYAYNDWAPGKMNLGSIGLKLERAIVDEETDTFAYVASNVSEQTEGESDSIIVVSFRGTASVSNMKTDLSFRQVPLPAKLSANTPSFNIRPGKTVVIEETAWDVKTSPASIIKEILQPSPTNKYSSWPTDSRSSINSHYEEDTGADRAQSILPAMTDGAKAIIRATPMARQALPCVHHGFLRNYLKVRQQIIQTILSVIKRQLDKAVDRCRLSENSSLFLDPEPFTLPKIYVTGHSLGGSLAQLLALDIASNCEIVIEQPPKARFIMDDHLRERERSSSIDLDQEEFWLGSSNVSRRKDQSKNPIHLRPPIAVYTFGQPRVGNLAFKRIYKQRVPHTFRVVTEGDAFTSMPSLTCFGGIYRHAGLEVVLDEGCTGNILVGPTVVETLLRFTKVRTSVINHSLVKYRDSLESALDKDELKEYYNGHGGKVKHDEEGHNFTMSSLPSWVTNNARRWN